MKIEKREKWVQICKIQGYEDVKDCYWISNSDEDIIMNRSTNKRVKPCLDNHGYKKVTLIAKDGKRKYCRIHILKAKAFLFGPNPLGANVVRHLNDIKTDNRLENLAWGTVSDNVRDSMRNGRYNYENFAKCRAKGSVEGGKATGAKNGRKSAKKLSKPVRCLETGIIYASALEAERQTGIANQDVGRCCRGKRKIAGRCHWEYVDTEE